MNGTLIFLQNEIPVMVSYSNLMNDVVVVAVYILVKIKSVRAGLKV